MYGFDKIDVLEVRLGFLFQLPYFLEQNGMAEELFGARAVWRLDFQAILDNVPKLFWVKLTLLKNWGDGTDFGPRDFSEELFHALGQERGSLCSHLINDASQRPNITFAVIRLVLPDFGGTVIGRSGLSVHHIILRDFAYVEIAQFVNRLILLILPNKYVSAFDISVADLLAVHYIQPVQNMD